MNGFLVIAPAAKTPMGAQLTPVISPRSRIYGDVIAPILKEMNFFNKFLFFNAILATQCRKPLIFQTINSVRSNSLSLKYQRFAPSGRQDIEIIQVDFLAKTLFFFISNCNLVLNNLSHFLF